MATPDREETIALLRRLQESGAARVKLDADGNLAEVEFYPGGVPAEPEAGEPPGPDPFELALRQIVTRSFDAGKPPS